MSPCSGVWVNVVALTPTLFFHYIQSNGALFLLIHPVTTLEWKAPLSIIRYPDPRLRAVNANIACFDDSLMTLAKEMIVLMYE